MDFNAISNVTTPDVQGLGKRKWDEICEIVAVHVGGTLYLILVMRCNVCGLQPGFIERHELMSVSYKSGF